MVDLPDNQFIKNNAYFDYLELIQQARSRIKPLEIYERHHILPKSLGGRAIKSNLVELTFEEHFLCHVYLVECVRFDQDKRKMRFALHCLSRSTKHTQRKLDIEQLIIAREANQVAMRGNKNAIALKGRPKSSTHRAKIAVALKGNVNGRGRLGKKHNPAALAKMSEAGREKIKKRVRDLRGRLI